MQNEVSRDPRVGELITECCLRSISPDERYCPRCGWEARVVNGDAYRLTFAMSPAGIEEFPDEPLSGEYACVEARPDYLVFERQTTGCTEGLEFFLHNHPGCEKHGQWWDEEYWTRLVTAEVIRTAEESANV